MSRVNDWKEHTSVVVFWVSKICTWDRGFLTNFPNTFFIHPCFIIHSLWRVQAHSHRERAKTKAKVISPGKHVLYLFGKVFWFSFTRRINENIFLSSRYSYTFDYRWDLQFGHDMSMVEIMCCDTYHKHNVRTSKQGVKYMRLLSILALIVVQGTT